MKNFIIRLRKSRKLSQKELAERIGISRPTLIAIEKGERDVTLSELKKISEIFDLPIEIILDEELGLSKKMEAIDSSQKSLSKFNNLILQCIKYGAGSDGRITKTKLAKLVYLCEFAHYYKHLLPISGFEYRKLPQGPIAIEFFDFIDSNESISAVNKGRAIMISLSENPNESVLSNNEKEIIRSVCTKWKKSNTKEIVDFTHSQLPWSMCKDRERIPYELINMEEPENVY